MRTKDTLFNIENIGLLLQYLYISPEHKITFNNGVTDLQLRMEDDLSVKCKNLRFPNVPESDWSSEITPANCISIIEILKEIHPDAPVESECLVDDGILDSLDIVTLVTALNAAFDVRIPAVEILPDNFNSVRAMAEMIERLDDV